MCLGFALNSDPGVHGPLLEADLIAPNHPRPITTQLYVVLTAPLFLQLFDGQITAPLSPFSKGGEGWTILFWFYRFVETQTRR